MHHSPQLLTRRSALGARIGFSWSATISTDWRRPSVPGTATAGNMLLDGGHPHSHPVRGRQSSR
jgi:hypothetical protein